jgi:hypothetical protein
MRFPRKLALGLGVFVATLLLVALVLPFMFRDRIAARIKTELDASVNAKLAWGGTRLSILRDFPNVSLGIDRLSIVGIAPFNGDTLLTMREARVVLDASSVIGYLRSGAPIVVREVALRQPSVRLRVLADGRANWDIAQPRGKSGADSSPGVGVTLRDLRISDGRVTLDDAQSRLVASVHGLQESLRGDFASDRFVLATRTRADSVSLRFAGVPYLSRVGVELNADVDADLRARRFTFSNDSLRLNQLVLAFTGSVVLGTPDMTFDLSFSTPSTAFKDILSLVPAVYASGFDRIQAAGSMSTSGSVRGKYGPNAFPALALRARVERGAFRDPSLPLPARDISLDLAIDNPGGHVDRTVIDLKRLHAVIGARPFDARMVMRTPVSDPDVDLRVVGALDLADVSRTVQLEGVSQLAGVIAADIAMRARLSDVDAGRYDKVAASGTVSISRFAMRSAAVPHPIAIDSAALRLTPRTAELPMLAARVGNSDVRASGSLENLLGFVLRGDDLRGKATLTSNHFDLNEWKSDEKLTEVIPVPAHVDFALQATAGRVSYGAITAANVRGNLRVKDQRVTLDELHMETMRGTVVANGFYETTDPARPTFDIDLRLAAVDIPSAFTALSTVQKFVPLARWAQGAVSGTIGVKGPIGSDMSPIFSALTGKGAIETERLVVNDAPVLARLADALKVELLRKPSLGPVKAAFDVANGRLLVKPFVVKANGMDMTVAGSNGIDQSIKYDLALATARGPLGAEVTGTVTNPTVRPNVSGLVTAVKDSAKTLVQNEIASRTAGAKQRADSAVEEARRRARAEADRLVAEAEKQAESIRAEARALAETARRQGNERADSLLAKATNPAARIAAKAGTDRLRREADASADRIVREADARADAIVAQAKKQADALASARG